MKTYSVKEIAEMMNTNPETVRRWIRSGKLKAVQTSRKEGNQVSPEELEDFLERNPKYTIELDKDNEAKTEVDSYYEVFVMVAAIMDFFNKKEEAASIEPERLKNFLKERITNMEDEIVRKEEQINKIQDEIAILRKKIKQYKTVTENDEIVKYTIAQVRSENELKEDK